MYLRLTPPRQVGPSSVSHPSGYADDLCAPAALALQVERRRSGRQRGCRDDDSGQSDELGEGVGLAVDQACEQGRDQPGIRRWVVASLKGRRLLTVRSLN